MTPKEKAKELVDRFLNEQNDTEEISQAKQCALICVDEVIESCFHPNLEYWQEVKQEINKIDKD